MDMLWTTIIATCFFASLDLIRRRRDDLYETPKTRSFARSAAWFAVSWTFFIGVSSQDQMLALQYGIIGGCLYFAIMLAAFWLKRKLIARRRL
jgi:hypothetical protein